MIPAVVGTINFLPSLLNLIPVSSTLASARGSVKVENGP